MACSGPGSVEKFFQAEVQIYREVSLLLENTLFDSYSASYVATCFAIFFM